MGNMWRTLWKRWKTMGGQGGCPLLSSDFYYVKKMKGFVQWWWSSPKNAFSLYLTFLPKFSNFSLVFSLGLCPNSSATCSSYSSRNVTRCIKAGVKLWFLHLNPNIAIVLCNGWRREKACQCQGSGIEGNFATTWGNLGQGKGHQGC